MDQTMKSLIDKLLNTTLSDQCFDALTTREKQINHLLTHRKCPTDGWPESSIELLINRLSLMDSNNFVNNVGLGERESRFGSEMVSRRHYRMGHGIGRSGDICEIQPKAGGSSLLNILANSLMLDMIQTLGVVNTKACFVAPVATGMAVVLCLLTLRHVRPDAKYVMWSRIDQKSCFKSIITAGFVPIIIDCKVLENGSLVTDMDVINQKLNELGTEKIVCILTTTSCFAPRNADDLEKISKLCLEKNIPHIVNNAYGIQSTKCLHLIETSSRIGRIDAFIQSTDKNFMVPVGGSVIAGFDKQFINQISATYPGRGSSTPSMDILITLLNLGINGFKRLLKERKEQYKYLKEQMETIANNRGETVLETKSNQISIAMTLNMFENTSINATELGSMLFIRSISGTRVVSIDGKSKFINGYEFKNWGSHTSDYKNSYLTAAAAIGVTKEDVDIFVRKLTKLLDVLSKKI